MIDTSNIEFVVLAAGKSTRNYPHSKGLPHKSLVPFGSRKIIDHIMSEIIEAGGKHVTFVVSDNKAVSAFKDCFKREKKIEEKFKKSNNYVALELLQGIYIPKGVKIKYVIQKTPKGLAHAAGLAATKAKNKNIVVILPDDVVVTNDGEGIIKKVVRQYLKNGGCGNLFLTRNVEDVSRWGIIENGVFREKPKVSTSNEASTMICIFDKKVGKMLAEVPKKSIKKNTEEYKKWSSGKELHYSDYVNEAVKQDPETMSIKTFKMSDKDLYLDCGTLKGYEKALIYTLLNSSKFKDENMEFAKTCIK